MDSNQNLSQGLIPNFSRVSKLKRLANHPSTPKAERDAALQAIKRVQARSFNSTVKYVKWPEDSYLSSYIKGSGSKDDLNYLVDLGHSKRLIELRESQQLFDQGKRGGYDVKLKKHFVL